MRDPNRIGPVLCTVAEFWTKHPELRLGQVLQIAAKDADPFYLEDDALVFAIRCGMECPQCEDRRLIEGATCGYCGRKG